MSIFCLGDCGIYIGTNGYTFFNVFVYIFIVFSYFLVYFASFFSFLQIIIGWFWVSCVLGDGEQ